MSHGFQPHYVSRASQQDQHGVLAFSGPPQAPSRSSVPGSQVHYSLEPASGGFSRAPLGVHTSPPYAQAAGGFPSHGQTSMMTHRFPPGAVPEYGPAYPQGMSTSPSGTHFPGLSVVVPEYYDDPVPGSSSYQQSPTEYGRALGSFYQERDSSASGYPERRSFEQDHRVDHRTDQGSSPTTMDYVAEPSGRRQTSNYSQTGKSHGQRRPSHRDEFDGPHQFLDMPSREIFAALEGELPPLPTNLLVQEQDDILSKVNETLSRCAFHFIARYRFPIPVEADKRQVSSPADREWTEWVFLLKRLATKRRIPAKVLFNGQIKQFVTILENSMEMRHAAMHQSRPLKDDRNVLQLISAGIQVTKILKDAGAMKHLDGLYVETENLINSRRNAQVGFGGS